MGIFRDHDPAPETVSDEVPETTAQPSNAPPAPDAFAAVAALVALIADPKATAARLAELRLTIEAAEKVKVSVAAEN